MKTRIIKIRVIPHSSKSEIVGQMADSALKIKLKAPPVGGRANEELIEVLSKELGVAKSGIRIVKGFSSKNKEVNIGYQ